MKNKSILMKKNLSILLLILTLGLTANATTYYFAANGNDGNSGTSSSSPWQTLSKLNSIASSLNPGDFVLLNRGDVFYGSITINRSGSSGAPITLGAYGNGAKPVIWGFSTVSSWNNLGGNIWESSNPVSSLSNTNMVVVNGVNTPMGRYPNSGFLYYQSHVGQTSITSNGLTGSTNWTGAELALHMATFTMGRDPITSQSGGTLTYTAAPNDALIQYDNQGFFIQNDPRTLDSLNEWYYNPSTKKLRIYSPSMPSNVMLTATDVLFNSNQQNYFVLDNISFQGSNSTSVLINNSKYSTVQNCDFNYTGKDAIYGPYSGNSTGFSILNCTMNNTNNTAIDLNPEFDNATIKSNSILNSGMVPGMGGGQPNNYAAIVATGANNLIQYNNIDGSGYVGINFFGSNSVISYNYVNNFCNVLHDGGGIYTWNIWPNTQQTNIKVSNNIVLNSATDCGIYMDDNSNGIEVSNNTVANCTIGIYLHNNWNMNAFNNTTYNNSFSAMSLYNDNGNVNMNNINLNNNIFFARTTTQLTGWLAWLERISYTSDYNYYARPVSDASTIYTYYNGVFGFMTLQQIQSLKGTEVHSQTSPMAVTNLNDIIFVYNNSMSNETVPLDATYIDVRNVSYNGSITLAPYASAVLIKNGPSTLTSQPPTANAGTDQTVTLPTNTATLSGSGTDPNGSISSYAWRELSGPSTNVISSPYTASTPLTSLVQGVYQFQLQVTDNSGLTARDTAIVTVNSQNASPSLTLLPAVNPGNTINGINYSYYESATGFGSVPNFGSLTPVKTGTSSNFDLTVANKLTNFAINFTGYINVPADGQYTFYTNSDDGSLLYIDNNLVVSNDGLHAALEQSGTIGLKAGLHAITVGYLQQLGSSLLNVSYASSSISKQLIPSTALYVVASSGNLLPAVNPGNVVNGINYSYYESATGFNTVPNFSSLTPVKTGISSNFDLTVANQLTNFAFNYTGYINVPADGQYTFYTNSDDGSLLYIDNVLVVSNDGLHSAMELSGTIGLQAGMHAIRVGYIQQLGYSLLNVSYSSSSVAKQLIPASALYVNSSGSLLPAVYPSNPINGINYSYYESPVGFGVVPNFSTITPVKTGTIPNITLTVANNLTNFAFDFVGYINVPADGQYTFYTNSDDGSLLYIDNVLVVSNNGLHSATELSGSIGLQAGMHAIKIGYIQQLGYSLLNVSYSSSSIAKQLIPSSALYYVPGVFSLSNNQTIISANEAVGVKAYPNPFTDYVMVDINGTAGSYSLQLVNVSGQVLWTGTGVKSDGKTQQTVNTSNLQRGVYFLKAIQNNKTTVVKLVK
jgi:parallel beta-helix repeat protein